jgi:hypothetical protein
MSQQAALKIDFVNEARGGKSPSIKSGEVYYNVKPEDFHKFKKGETVHCLISAKEGKGKWAGRTFYDIVGVIASDSTGTATNGNAQPATNGNGAVAPGLTGQAKDRRIGIQAIAKMVGPIPFSNRETMANQMTEICLAAGDAYDRIFSGDEIPF